MTSQSRNTDQFFDEAFAAARSAAQTESAVERSPAPDEIEESPAVPVDAVDAVELPADLDDDGWFDAVSTGATGRAAQTPKAVPADTPAGAASLPLDGDLIRPARKPRTKTKSEKAEPKATKPPRVKPERAPIPPKAPKPAKVRAERPKRERAPKPPKPARPVKTPKAKRTAKPTATTKAARRSRRKPVAAAATPTRRGPRTVALGGVLLVGLIVAAIAGGAFEAQEPKTTQPRVLAADAAAAPSQADKDRAAMQAAADRGDYGAAIELAQKLNDPAAADRFKTAAAGVMVRRARQAAERGDLALSRSRLQRARERYGATPDAARVTARIRSIEKARADRARLRQRRAAAAARRRAARPRRAAAAPAVRRSPAPTSSGSAPRATPTPAAPSTPAAPVRRAPVPSSPSPRRSPAPSGGGSRGSGSSGGSSSDPAPAPAPAPDPVQ